MLAHDASSEPEEGYIQHLALLGSGLIYSNAIGVCTYSAAWN